MNSGEFTLGAIIGMVLTTFIIILAVTIRDEKTIRISTGFECTQTKLVGETPNRKETCIQYTLKGEQDAN